LDGESIQYEAFPPEVSNYPSKVGPQWNPYDIILGSRESIPNPKIQHVGPDWERFNKDETEQAVLIRKSAQGGTSAWLVNFSQSVRRI
jgi:hypothetical protein